MPQGNDVSERSLPSTKRCGRGSGQELRQTFGRSVRGFVTADEIPNPQRLNVWLRRHGERMQGRDPPRTMIFFPVRDHQLSQQHDHLVPPVDVI